MTSVDQITAIVQILTAAVAVIGILFTVLSAILEHWRWRRTTKLEERKWAEEVNNKIEIELLQIRLKDYPRIIAELEPLSKHAKNIAPETAQQIGKALHAELYEPVVISMKGDTRKALANLRDACYLYAQGRLPSDNLARARTYFLSTLFRDVGVLGDWNPEVPSLIASMSKDLAAAYGNEIGQSHLD